MNLKKKKTFIKDFTVSFHLLLPQDDHSSRFDGVPGCQVVTSSQLLPVLVSLPLTISRGPRDADVVPPAVANLQGKLSNLGSKRHYNFETCVLVQI